MVHMADRDIEIIGYDFPKFAVGTSSSDRPDVIFRKSISPMPAIESTTSFVLHVSGIVLSSSKKKMSGIDACRNIAGMTDHLPDWDWSVIKFPCKSVRSNAFGIKKADASIALCRLGPGEKPAVRTFFSKLLKKLFGCPAYVMSFPIQFDAIRMAQTLDCFLALIQGIPNFFCGMAFESQCLDPVKNVLVDSLIHEVIIHEVRS